MEKAAEQVREARTESVRQSYLKTKKILSSHMVLLTQLFDGSCDPRPEPNENHTPHDTRTNGFKCRIR